MKAKIINIMTYPTAYELFWNESKPQTSWDLPDGQWLGIWGDEWLDMIGEEVLRLTDEFEYEVWQPDLRADKVYSHSLADGSVHSLFPAIRVKERYGLKTVRHVISPVMYERIANENKQGKIVLRLDAPSRRMTRDILDLDLKCPKFMQFFGEFQSPLNSLFKVQKNVLSKLHTVTYHFKLKDYLRAVDAITYTSEVSRRNLDRYSDTRKRSLSIGIDFDYWKRSEEQDGVRRKLNLGLKKKVLFSSGRLVGLKQVDKVIMVLNKLDGDFDFVLVVTGHGEEAYEKYLTHLGERLVKKGKLKFAGFLCDDKLRDLYTTADLFIMSSASEAGPTVTIKALAMEVPVFSTDTGQMAEVLAQHNAGVIVPRKGYRVWEGELAEILRGKQVTVLDRDIVKKIHHWPYVAQQYIELYRELLSEYYG
jgi:glycosyltransferase involved in cell wall biosynthesis